MRVRTTTSAAVFDPVDHQWYASAEAAGFPSGRGVGALGAIFVPGQAAFLGWAANGEPEFGVGGCFIVCLGSALTGAASAVSSFVGCAASTVSNAVGRRHEHGLQRRHQAVRAREPSGATSAALRTTSRRPRAT